MLNSRNVTDNRGTMELPLLSLPFLCALFLLLLILRGIFNNSKAQAQNPSLPSPPGPWKLPILGSIHHLIGTLAHRKLRDLALVHGSLMLLQLGQIHVAVASSREAAEEITKTHDLKFASRPEMVVSRIIGYGGSGLVFHPYGESWKKLRKICMVELLSAKRVKSFSSIRAEEVLNMLKEVTVEEASTSRRPVVLRRKLMSMTNGITCRATFGERCAKKEKFLSLVKDAVDLVTGLTIPDMFPSVRFLEVVTGLRSKLERMHLELDEILDEMIEQHRAEKLTNEEDLVHVLLRVKDGDGFDFPLTFTIIKAVILDVFVGGTDTTTVLIEWVLSELVKNPAVMEKVQKEVREAMKGRTTKESSDLARLNYLSLVIKETLRLHPPGPLLPRECLETCQVLGYKISAGTRVFINVWAIGRDSRYWDDPESFRPERFKENSVDYKGASYEFLPFGAGRRMCPGMGFALANAELALASLLFYFDWELPSGMNPEDLDMVEEMGASSCRKSALCLVATPRIPLPVRVL